MDRLFLMIKNLKIPTEFKELKDAIRMFHENIEYLDKNKIKEYIHENIFKALCKDVGIKYEDKTEVTDKES